jgi:pimeloyl-ACP methyl ester carboxylesterase
MSKGIEPRSTTIHDLGLPLNVHLWGRPDAPPLLLLHGMRDQSRSWDPIAAALLDRYHVITPDLRGHGASGWASPEAYTLAAFVLDLALIVRALDLPPASLIGHSLGGAIALRYAAAFPHQVRALCAIEAVELPIVRDHRHDPKPFPTRMRAWIDAEAQRRGRPRRRYESPADAEIHLRRAQAGLDADTAATLCRHALVQSDDGSWCWKYDPAARHRPPDDPGGEDLDEMLAAIACPTMLAYGAASWIPLPPAERLARIKDVRVEHFPDSSHWLHLQARPAFLATLTRFLDQGPNRAA